MPASAEFMDGTVRVTTHTSHNFVQITNYLASPIKGEIGTPERTIESVKRHLQILDAIEQITGNYIPAREPLEGEMPNFPWGVKVQKGSGEWKWYTNEYHEVLDAVALPIHYNKVYRDSVYVQFKAAYISPEEKCQRYWNIGSCPHPVVPGGGKAFVLGRCATCLRHTKRHVAHR